MMKYAPLLFLWAVASTHAFTTFLPSNAQHVVTSRTALNYNNRRSSEDQLDETRRRLERMLDGSSSSSSSSSSTHHNDPAPTLTSGARKRLELEIELLESLGESDEAIPHLMNLWVHECPSASEEIEKLQYLDRLGPRNAEAMLTHMVKSYPQWPEPAARLALLVGLNKRSDEALYYMDQVLSRKPWHFEVQHMQVLISLQHNNFPRAIRAARIRLPPRTQPNRRKAWVTKAVGQAKEQLRSLSGPPPPQLPTMPMEGDSTEDDFFSEAGAWQ